MKYYLSLTFFSIVFHPIFAQNTSSDYYQRFDDLVNSYSNDLNNGLLFEDAYRTDSQDEFRFFMLSSYTTGSILYKNQPFFECTLKYDLLDDNLLFKNINKNNAFGIVLNALNIQGFTIYGKEFLKLPIEASKFSFYKNGFFEKAYEDNVFVLFIKHEKFKKKKIGNEKVFFEYSKRETFLLEYKSAYYEINSKNDIIKILPDKKNDIKIFFRTNSILERENPSQFMIQLFRKLNANN